MQAMVLNEAEINSALESLGGYLDYIAEFSGPMFVRVFGIAKSLKGKLRTGLIVLTKKEAALLRLALRETGQLTLLSKVAA